MAEGPIRQDTRSIMVTIFAPGSDAVIMKGVWDVKTGGGVDSEERVYHPGAMAASVSLGGRTNVENVVCSRLCRVGRDWALIPRLVSIAGKARVSVTDQPLDFDGNASGINGLTYTGILKRVTPPEANSESSDPAMIEIEITPDGVPA